MFDSSSEGEFSQIPPEEGAEQNQMQILASVAFHTSLSLADKSSNLASQESGQVITEHEKFRAFIEYIMFFCQHYDREAFIVLGPNRKRPVMNSIVHAILAEMSQMYDTDEEYDRFKHGFIDTFNDTQASYVQFKRDYPGESEPLSGTFFGEFAKRVAAVYRVPDNCATTIAIVQDLKEMLPRYNLRSAFEGLK